MPPSVRRGATLKSVAVVVLSWNNKQAVLDSIDRAIRLQGAEIRVVVVDNASTDDSVTAIRQAYPNVTVLESKTNEGYAGGVNRGLAEAARLGSDFAWLLNDDTVFDETVLLPLLAAANDDARKGLLSPLIVDLDDRDHDQFRNGLVDWEKGVMRHNVTAFSMHERVAAGATPIVPGTAVLCDLRVFGAIGHFDPRYFAYWEDTDYAVRAAKAGFSSTVVPASTLQHAATSARRLRPPHYHYYMIRNEALFWRLHGKDRGTRHWQRRWLTDALDWLVQVRDTEDRTNAHACVDGLWHAMTRRYGSRESHRPAPKWLRGLLISRTYFFHSLINGDFRAIARRLLRRR